MVTSILDENWVEILLQSQCQDRFVFLLCLLSHFTGGEGRVDLTQQRGSL